MYKIKSSYQDLLKKNKEEILNDKEKLEKIEIRMEEKYIKNNN